MGLRLKGIDSRITLAGPEGVVFAISRIKSFDTEFMREILTEDYMGESTPDFDEVDNGVGLKIEFHLNDPAFFDFIDMVGKRARREIAASTKWTGVSTYNFPDGGRRRIVIPNLFFGAMPVNGKDRKQYISSTVEARARQAFFKS